METLAPMPATTRQIQGTQFPPELQKEFNVKPHQLLKVTVETLEVEKGDNEDYDVENLGDALIESFQELLEAKKQGKKLTNARDFLKTL